MKETQESVIELREDDPQVVEAMLYYMYVQRPETVFPAPGAVLRVRDALNELSVDVLMRDAC